MGVGLRVHRGGDGEPVLLMIHGLGASSDVWTGVRSNLPGRWPGAWMAPDLPGHGRSTPLDDYTFDALTAELAQEFSTSDRVVVLGHSLGGVIGVMMAGGRFDVDVIGVVGLGIKVSWTQEELGRAQAVARRPVSWFDSREDAAQRYLRTAGLTGLLQPSDDAVIAGLVEDSGRWRPALDPRAFGVGAPDMPLLLAQAKAPVLLARGEHDQLVSDDQLRDLVPDPVTLPGVGHNAHVERPDAVVGLLGKLGF
jgi:pimeloyl-ACP methyl ester carboxylesterase